MRSCPKEKETVETCDGMNQKNTIFDKSGPKITLITSKITKNKKKLTIQEIRMRKKIDLSIYFP